MTAFVAREAMPVDFDEHLLLSVFRFIGAAYETGDAACWDAAHAAAEAARGLFDGAMLVAQAAAVIRVIRMERTDFRLLPPSSRWLSSNETWLMRLVRMAADGDGVTDSADMLRPIADSHRLLETVKALVEAGSRPSAFRSRIRGLKTIPTADAA